MRGSRFGPVRSRGRMRSPHEPVPKSMVEQIHNTPASLNRSYGAPELVNQRRVTLEQLGLRAGEDVLDVGCGSGFLTLELARAVGESGSVAALDLSGDMVDAARERCRGLAQVTFGQGNVTALPMPPDSYDAVTCTQVLLYVEDVETALAQMVRVLRPGGRLAVLETDWRGVVMNSADPGLTDAVYRAWDDAVPSPNLPVRLEPLMRAAGLRDLRVTAIPLLNTEFDPGLFSVSSLDWLGSNAVRQGAVTQKESRRWREGLERLGREGEYFFCVNRFLFVGHKP